MSFAVEAVAPSEGAARRETERRNYRIAIHLAMFAAGILIPVLLIVTFMLINTARLLRDDALHDAGLIAQHLNETIDVELEKAIAVDETLATALALDDGQHAAFEAQARVVAKRLGMNITVRDASDRQIVNTYMPVGSPLPEGNESIQAIDRLAAQRDSVVISDLRTATLRKVPTVNAVMPVVKGSQVAYFVSATMSPTRLGEILSAGLPNGWIAGLVGRDGRLIARNADQARYIGTDNPAFLAVATQPEGVWTGLSRDGIAIAGVYVRSPLSGWIVSVAVPEAILREPAKLAMLSLVGLVVASLAVSTLLGWWLSRRVAAPIRDLALRARELGEGRMQAAAHSGVSEVNEVMEALQAASDELDRRAAAANQASEAVRANEERLQLVQDTAGIGTIDWDIEADRAVCSPRFYELFSRPVGSRMDFAGFIARVHPLERTRIQGFYEHLREQGGPFEDEFRMLRRDGEERWIYLKGRLDLQDGRPARLLGACIDITERKQSEQHLRFLLRELSHRSKNLLAVIQAMAGQTAKSAETVDVFRRRFGDRLMGLAASHDLLVNQNWLGVSVEHLVRGQLAPFLDPQDPRLQLHGPDVDLKAEAAEALGLALHELGTNSLKYGALKDPAGTVEISWIVCGSEASIETGGHVAASDGRRFHMEWVEHTVDAISPPTHKGFGRMVIEHTVQATLRGAVTLEFPPEGLRWRIDAPAACLAPQGSGVAA
ncbi:MAG: HWE histidine kinase domain-containing protein [Acetobacteraceae bacterium]